MNKERSRSILPSLISSLLLVAVFVAAEVLYGFTKYLPLCLFALTCLLPAGFNLIVMLTYLKLPLKKVRQRTEDAEVSSEIPDSPEEDSKKRKTSKKKRKGSGKSKWNAFAEFYNRYRGILACALALVGMVLIQIRFFTVQIRLTSLYVMNYPILIGMALIFTVFIALDKWCQHSKTGNPFTDSLTRNLRSVLALLRLALGLMMIASALKIFGIYDTQSWMKYILMAFFYYESLFLLLSFAVTVIKKQLFEEPVLYVPAPFAIGDSKELSLLTYFEENTGMTMRSLWSIRMVKTLIPYTITLAALLLWLSTGLVQVGPNQTGVVYRFGKMAEEPLEPGLHLCLPWPMDKYELYDTENVQRFTVGYVSDSDDDNTWTGKHGSEEYRLLLGSRDELVSINLRVEYKIGDIKQYLSNNATPVDLVKAQAYDLVIDHTISNDLETLLTLDRELFAEHFKNDLINGIQKYETGLEIVSVVLESIHPPIEISQVYQDIISAEIEAQKLILDAQAAAAVIIADAETQKDTTVYTALVNQFSAIASAEAEVSEFMASVGADEAYPSTYRYYKYLKAISAAYGNTRLVIVGDGIDSSIIYFGSLIVNGNTGTVTPPTDDSYEEYLE